MKNFPDMLTRRWPVLKDQRLWAGTAGLSVLLFAFFILKDTNPPPVVRYTVGILFAAAAIAAGFWRAEIALYLLTAYIPFAMQMPGDFDGRIPGFTLSNFLLILNGVLWASGRFGPGTRRWKRSPMNPPLLTFTALGVVSILQGAAYGSVYLAQAFSLFIYSWGIGFFFYFLVLHTASTPERRLRLVQILMFSTTVAALMASYEYLDTGERAGGIFNHANLLASFFCYYLFIPLAYFLLNMRSLGGWIALGSFAVIVRGVMVSFSRGGYLAIAVGGLVVTFCRSKILFFAVVGGLLFAVMNPQYLPEGVRWRLAQTFEKTPQYAVQQGQAAVHLDRSTSDRFELWKAALHIIRQNPVWGAGYNRFLGKMQNYWYAGFSFEPHNTFLFIPAEMGIPALFVFLWILGLILAQSIRVYVTSRDAFYRPLSLGVLGGVFGYIVSNCYAPRLDYPEIVSYLWILTAILFLYEPEKKS